MTNTLQHIKETFAEVSRQHQYMSIPLEIRRVSEEGMAPILSTEDIRCVKSDAPFFRFYKIHFHL